MGAVRLTATLAAPIVITDDLHLDGLLASAHPRCREEAISRDTPVSRLAIPSLPICHHTFDGARIALASVAQLPDTARLGEDRAVRRRDGEDIAQTARPLHLGLGPGKNRLHKLPIVVTPSVSWLAIGAPRELRKLARRLAFLGGWRSAGYGAVTSWTADYEPADVDPVSVLVADGVAQRHLPARWCTWAESTTVGPLVSPYWHPGRQTEEIVRAGTRCALHLHIEEAVRAAADPAAHRAHRDRKDARRSARRAGAYPPDLAPGLTGDACH